MLKYYFLRINMIITDLLKFDSFPLDSYLKCAVPCAEFTKCVARQSFMKGDHCSDIYMRFEFGIGGI